MVQAYRRAIAGAAVTVVVFALGAVGVDVPSEVGAAAVTLAVFGLGFLPNKQAE